MTQSLPRSYQRAVFKALNSNLVLEEVPLTLPGPGEILVKTEACGICHSDVFAQENTFGVSFPRVPGHEIIGKIVAVGERVLDWKCKIGQTQMCRTASYNGITRDGGLAEYCLLLASAAVHVPIEGDAAKLAHLLCAGSTVFLALKSANITPGQPVAIQGLAAMMCYRVIAISRGTAKEAEARSLGAHDYIDATKGDVGDQLWALGGAQLALTTALGLRSCGKLLVVTGVPGPITIDGTAMIMRGISVRAWPCPSVLDNEQTMEFSQIRKIDCTVETFPLNCAQDAYDAMLKGTVRFRAVVTMD
ncbi:alcohol dehydrogenase 1 [Xylaria venustula]|nr:alcohol dehydrogenase 1 [Xylaria venustula]